MLEVLKCLSWKLKLIDVSQWHTDLMMTKINFRRMVNFVIWLRKKVWQCCVPTWELQSSITWTSLCHITYPDKSRTLFICHLHTCDHHKDRSRFMTKTTTDTAIVLYVTFQWSGGCQVMFRGYKCSVYYSLHMYNSEDPGHDMMTIYVSIEGVVLTGTELNANTFSL